MKKVTFCKLKTSLSRKFIYNLQTFRRLCQVHFTILLQILHENNLVQYLTLTSNFSGRLKQYCLLFSGIGALLALLCHLFYCFHSQLCEPFSEVLLDWIIFYLPVNTYKPSIVAFSVFVCKTASSIAQISSSENASKRDAILAPVVKQWITKVIPSYRSQSKRAKSAIYWFGKHYKLKVSPCTESTYG